MIVNADALRIEGEQLGMHCRWALLQNGIDAERFRSQRRAPPHAPPPVSIVPVRSWAPSDASRTARATTSSSTRCERLVATGNGTSPQGLIVGDGPLRVALEGHAATIGLAGRVRFTGTVADVRPLLAAMDVFVLPSWAEGMSNALMEAMAAATPRGRDRGRRQHRGRVGRKDRRAGAAGRSGGDRACGR